jgi:tetratricopeptide (TPR) repeat protein
LTGDPANRAALELVHRGWHELQLQRPLAAWADWQQALRLEPGNAAASQAIERVADATELPAAARVVYRFWTPSDSSRRAKWNERFEQGDLPELSSAAAVFAALTNDAPDDAEARFNLALCHAWMGQNVAAVSDLDRVVALLAGTDLDRAIEAWTLAEVLRQGAGAESISDDCRYAWIIDWPDGQGPPSGFLDAWPNLVERPIPTDPVWAQDAPRDARAFEWLDRPMPDHAPRRAEDLPRVLGTVVCTGQVLRVSSPDPTSFSVVTDRDDSELNRVLNAARREKTPLPIGMADAGLATYRFPPGLDEPAKAELARAAVEDYFERRWIHLPRQSLGGVTPLAISRNAGRGDQVALARLSAVVNYREQLGARATHAAVYEGYPFDRLRRRLGLRQRGEGLVDPDDVSCMNETKLSRIDPSTLAVPRLVDAFTSANSLQNDEITARFSAEILRRGAEAIPLTEPAAVVAPLVREAIRMGEPEAALSCIDQARLHTSDANARTLRIWAAEIHARTDLADESLRIYKDLLRDGDGNAALALDGSETLLDAGHEEQARELLLEARDRALESGEREIARKAEALLDNDE